MKMKKPIYTQWSPPPSTKWDAQQVWHLQLYKWQQDYQQDTKPTWLFQFICNKPIPFSPRKFTGQNGGKGLQRRYWGRQTRVKSVCLYSMKPEQGEKCLPVVHKTKVVHVDDPHMSSFHWPQWATIKICATTLTLVWNTKPKSGPLEPETASFLLNQIQAEIQLILLLLQWLKV